MKTKPCKPPRARHDWEHYANKTVQRRFADGSVELSRRGIWYCTACKAAKYGEAREQVHVVVGHEPPNVGVVPASPGARRNAARRMTAARDFSANTCGASRHAQQLAEVLMSDKPLWHVTDDRQHSGESIAATVEALWRLRSAAIRLLAALDNLDDGCREPGFRGWTNGNGVRCGDEAERARKALARLARGHNG